MSKPAIDLSRYKAKAGKQTILLDYSRAEVNERCRSSTGRRGNA